MWQVFKHQALTIQYHAGAGIKYDLVHAGINHDCVHAGIAYDLVHAGIEYDLVR